MQDTKGLPRSTQERVAALPDYDRKEDPLRLQRYLVNTIYLQKVDSECSGVKDALSWRSVNPLIPIVWRTSSKQSRAYQTAMTLFCVFHLIPLTELVLVKNTTYIIFFIGRTSFSTVRIGQGRSYRRICRINYMGPPDYGGSQRA
ncbi:hypothetical protein EVAR_71226_1 [Eumeta japonica]|uniref:Uncharacterized protein n=1 Tax=Eumeta variegata TaxID=151549 RepID=A0A4C1STZ5_EUMVA|nr:hypothetical protein EVAR_71226_1 [Eumeta japonica]